MANKPEPIGDPLKLTCMTVDALRYTSNGTCTLICVDDTYKSGAGMPSKVTLTPPRDTGTFGDLLYGAVFFEERREGGESSLGRSRKWDDDRKKCREEGLHRGYLRTQSSGHR